MVRYEKNPQIEYLTHRYHSLSRQLLYEIELQLDHVFSSLTLAKILKLDASLMLESHDSKRLMKLLDWVSKPITIIGMYLT